MSTEAGPSVPTPLRRAYEPRAPLVNQVDADSLDDGIAQMLGEGVERAIHRWRPSLAPDFRPEIELLLKLLCFGVGVLGPSIASPGAALQNLRLASSRRAGRPTRSSLLLYLVLHPPLLPRYLLTRARSTALSRQWPDLPAHDRRRKLWNLLVRIENAARAWELAGWAWFLWDGKYPSLLMRILGLRLVPSAPRLARMVSYEYMNRQLVWGVMTEFLLFAIPRIPTLPSAINPATVVAPVTAFLRQPTTIDYQALSDAHAVSSAARKAGAPAPAAAHAGALAGIPASTCPVCFLRRTSASVALPGTDIELPQLDVAAGEEEQGDHDERIFVPAVTDCWGECKYCYYCIADELAQHAQRDAKSEDKWTCLRCGGGVTRAKRLGAAPGALQQPSESETESSSDVDSGGIESSHDSGIDSETERLGQSWQDVGLDSS